MQQTEKKEASAAEKKESFFHKVRASVCSGAERVMNAGYNIFEGKKKMLVFIGIWALILNFFLELSLRRNPVNAVVHIFTQPFVYAFNALLIFAVFSILLFLKRRMFSFVFISLLWITLPIVNAILLTRRNTPFNGSDFRLLLSAFEIVGEYLSVIEIILVLALIFGAIGFAVLMFIKGRKSKRNMYFSGVSFSVIMSVTIGSVLLFNGTIDSSHFSNLPDAYKEFGFAYSFICSVIDHGIEKPDGYDDSMVKSVLEQIDGEEESVDEASPRPSNAITASKDKPNVIFIQLESFYDPANIEGISFSRDPIPIFRRLMEENMSGWFTVPSIGAGTANTEFEVLTGMDIDHFGIAEYPYLSILQNNTCESIAYNFKEYGYAAHVMHNHTGTFYDRYIVFPNLGFDTFISIENMTDITRNETGWAKDSMLVDEIMGVMTHTNDQADLVYAISVQPHGKYPVTEQEFLDCYNGNNPAPIKVTGNEESLEKYGFDFWVNQVYDVDLFIGDLIKELEAFDEPVMLVMFGDHLPAFAEENLINESGSYYCTEYVIWSNYGLENKGDKDLYTFQLASYVSDMIGIESGYMNRLHQEMADKSEEYAEESLYSDEMHILQYDMLYGEKYAYGGKNAYLPANTRFGYKDIVIDEIKIQGETLYVYGKGFNDGFSHIYINGSEKNTIFLKKGCVIADNVMLNEGDVIKVVQSSSDRIRMNESNAVVYKN